MARDTKEWIGRDDNHRAPGKVRDRLRLAFPNCYLCTRKIETGEPMALDHVVALINGGENRESNLRPVHQACHATKTAADVAEKARIAKKRKAIAGIVDAPARPLQSRGFTITKEQAQKRARREAGASSKLPVPGASEIARRVRVQNGE